MGAEPGRCEPEHDEAGRLVRLRAPDGSVTEFCYECWDRGAAPLTPPPGTVVTVEGPEGTTWTYEYHETTSPESEGTEDAGRVEEE